MGDQRRTGQQDRVDRRQDGRDERAREQHVGRGAEVLPGQFGHELFRVGEAGREYRSTQAEHGGNEADRQVEAATDQAGAPRGVGRPAAQDARDQLDGEHRPDHGHGPGLGRHVPRGVWRAEQGQAVGWDLRPCLLQRAAAHQQRGQHHQADDDGEALHHVRPRVGQQAADGAVPDDEQGRAGDRHFDGQRRGVRHHVAEGANLRGAPQHGRRHHQQDGDAFDEHAVAEAEQVAEGGEAAVPQRAGEDEADEQDAGDVAERVGRPA